METYILTKEDPQYRSIESYYSEGFDCGYKWLRMGIQFLHPLSPRGYTPGGPIVWAHRYENGEDKKRKDAWRTGWKDGINTYVLEHNLSYPQIV